MSVVSGGIMRMRSDNNNNNECAWIEDGYTKDGYVARIEGLHPAISFRFRPMIQPERSRIQHEQKRAKTPEESEAMAAREIARRVTEWDITKANGDLVSISEKNVLRVQPNAFYAIWLQVLGATGPDAKPDLDNSSDLHTAYDGETQEDVDAKN